MGAFGEFQRYDAVALAKLVRDRQVSPTELLDAAIECVESRNPVVNAVVSRLYDDARRAIAAGLPDGLFTGVPFLLKDIGALLTGTRTTFGSRMFTTFVADHDSELVARYRRSGLVVFGKTNTPEFGIAPTTEPQLFGPTKNPWNLGYSPGGSSGGECRGGRLRHGASRARERRRRIDPHSRLVLRALRAETDSCADADGTGSRRGLGRNGGEPRHHAHRTRQRGATRRHGGPRRRRSVLGAAAHASLSR